MHLVRLLSILSILCFGFELYAQHAQEITVEVVDVPVYVTLRGEPVGGLTRADFELRVNGKAQPIDYFDTIDLRSASDVAGGGSLRQRRLFLFIFDLCFSKPPSILRARKAAAEMVVAGGPRDLYSIATFTHNRGLWFVVPFTSDRTAVLEAISTLRASGDDPLQLQIAESARSGWLEFSPVVAEDPFADMILPLIDEGNGMRALLAEPRRRLQELGIRDLADVSARMARLDGQKHVILLSEGFSVGFTEMDDLMTMSRAFQATGGLLHAVDTAGLRAPYGGGGGHSLSAFSADTGGQFVHNSNDLGGALEKLADDHRYVYLLGFKPQSTRRGLNRIEVKVKNLPRRAQVTYRRAFSTTPVEAEIDASRDGLRLADIIQNDVPQTGLSSRLDAKSNTLTAYVPARLAAAQLGGQGEVEVLLYIFDGKGAANRSHVLRTAVDRSAGEIVPVHVSVDLPPGRYIVKALTRVGEALGLSKLEFTHGLPSS